MWVSDVTDWRYSRQDCKGDKCNGETEDGNGAANVTDGWQRHPVAGGELCMEEHHGSDNQNNITLFQGNTYKDDSLLSAGLSQWDSEGNIRNTQGLSWVYDDEHNKNLH